MTQDMEREHKKHRVTPFRGLTNRLPYVAASLRGSIHPRGENVNLGRSNGLDKTDGVRIIIDRKGTLQQAVNPYV